METRSFAAPELVRRWNNQNYRVVICGQQVRCVVLGESHASEHHLVKQAELIELMHPELVLHEFGPAQIYDPRAGGHCWQPGRIADHEKANYEPDEGFPEVLTRQADRLGHRIAGIDLTMTELRIAYWRLAQERPDEFRWEQYGESILGGSLVKRKNPGYEFTTQDPVSVKLRDAQMVKEIGHYEKASKSPIIVIVGDHHAGNFHRRGLLREYGFGYIIVHQRKLRKPRPKAS